MNRMAKEWVKKLLNENFGCFDPLVVKYLNNDILATEELLKRLNNLYLKEKNIMNYKITTVNNEGFGFELKEKQLKQLYAIQEEKLNKIGAIFDLGNIKPHHTNYRYEYDVKDTMTNEGVYSYITPQFKDENKANDNIWDISKRVSLNPFVELVFDGSLYIDGSLDEDFLTIWQWELLNTHIKEQKDRAKKLFLNLYRESDRSWSDKSDKYCIQWNHSSSNNRITTRYFKNGKYFTPVFSSEKVQQIIEKYRDELTWYFTKYDPTVVMRVQIEFGHITTFSELVQKEEK